MASDNRVPYSVHLPQVLAEELDELARVEDRRPELVLEEALRQYVRHKRILRHYAYGEQRASEQPYRENDVPELVQSMRRARKHAQR
jgi:metal-responsive CopG/Arc/MetJ family transcriptional regulator